MNLESAILINNNTTFQTLIKFLPLIELILFYFCFVHCNSLKVKLRPELANRLGKFWLKTTD